MILGDGEKIHDRDFNYWRLPLIGLVLGPSRTSRRVLSFAFLPGSARLCVFFSTPVTRIDGLGRRVLCFAFLLGSARLCVIFSTPVTRIDGLGGGGVRVGGGWGGVLDSVLSPASCCIFVSTRS